MVGQLRIALCQIDTVVGDLDGNVVRVLEALETAEAEAAQLAVFPELTLVGYPPEDLLLRPDFVAANLDALERLALKTGECAAVVGFVEPCQRLYNAAAVVANGTVHGIWRKHALPNYSVFDEQRWFAEGSGEGPLYVVGGVPVGIAICEDAWSPNGPVARHAAGGAELVVVLNASPYRTGVLAEREQMLSVRAADAGVALGYVNLVGGQDELVFDGASMCFDAGGVLVERAPQFTEAVVICDLDTSSSYRKRLLDPRGRPVAPLLERRFLSAARTAPGDPAARGRSHTGRRSHTKPPAQGWAHNGPGLLAEAPPPSELARLEGAAEVLAALELGLVDYVTKNGFSDVVLGLSGGIDSAVVASIAAAALGPARVHAVLLPSRYTSAASLEDASELARRLGIDASTISIEPGIAALEAMLADGGPSAPSGTTAENIQARLRGVVLMARSNAFGWLLLTTGNKSEMAVGYATLYGDMAGGFAVLKDVPKTLVYAVAHELNRQAASPVIPQSIIVKAPSAELRFDQRDDDSLPPYDILDPILEGYVEADCSPDELIDRGFAPEVVAAVVTLVDRAEYKRRQSPPGIRVTSRAFGKDRRMPITNGFRPGSAG
jgi:NAD+ synthase (glutamine-hydrolysing)